MRRRLYAQVFFLGWAAIPLAAQNAQLSGLVTDPSKAVVPSAAVSVANQATGAKRETVSNSDGAYAVASLPPGRYHITVKAAGFSIAERNVVLEVAQNARLDFVLGIDASTQSVTVSG